ncbi:Glutamate--tRNA ligase-like protein [Elsinoe fawcettii]|nr:Glutamate--tRNA ligase-like protein [Elsinoe fawcettii]
MTGSVCVTRGSYVSSLCVAAGRGRLSPRKHTVTIQTVRWTTQVRHIHQKRVRKVFDISQTLTPARTRFAPSPTGFLHLGSLRTAVFNYLWAKRTGGQFILRVEDTDRKRTVSGAEKRLCEDLKWAGLEWDEGPGVGGRYRPYNQSARNELYQYHANELIDTGHAYRCFCPASMPTADNTEPTEVGAKLGGCSGDCKGYSQSDITERIERKDTFVVRFNSQQDRIIWSDVVYGEIMNKADSGSKMFNSIADTVLVKSDGTPTYHLANVVDDHDMKITHVIRGTEWMPSTPLHVALYEAFRWQPPLFAHVSLLTDEGHNKLSKRNFDVDVGSLVQKYGLMPESLVNYLVLLGWSNPDKKDVKSMQELIDVFDLKFTKGDTVVSFEKLFFLQRQHAMRRVKEAISSPEASNKLDLLVGYLRDHAKVKDWHPQMRKQILGNRTVDMYLQSILVIDPGNYETPRRYLHENNYFFRRAAYREAVEDANQEPPLPDNRAESTSPFDRPDSGRPVSREIELTFGKEVKQLVDEIIDHQVIRDSLALWNRPQEDVPRNVKELHDQLAQAAQPCQDILNALLIGKVSHVLRAKGAEIGDESIATLKKTAEWKQMTVDFHKYLRSRLSGRIDGGPSTFRVMAVLGYEESRLRIKGNAVH